MKTLLYIHEACLAHQVPPENPETPARLAAVRKALSGPEFAALERRSAPEIDLEILRLVHPQSHIDRIGRKPGNDSGFISLDYDTALSAGTFGAALRAAGALVQAVDDVMAGQGQTAFCAVRPPGHHARPEKAMGFCYFSTIAIAALHARQAHNLERIALVDFDVHHGNGSQEVLWDVPGSLFISLHQKDHYPGTGLASETGGKGAVLNLPMAGGTSASSWMRAFENKVLPALEAHAPQMIFVSAGFDAHRDDPLGDFCLRAADYRQIGFKLAKMAQRHARSRLVCALEGGYDLGALERCARAFVQALVQA